MCIQRVIAEVLTNPMPTVRIPNDIFRRTIILGLSPLETLGIVAVPVLGVFPARFFEFIPMWGAIVFGAVFFLTAIGVAASTPPGQTPLEWGPAFLASKIRPKEFVLRTKHVDRGTPVYQTTSLTGLQPGESSDDSATGVGEQSTADRDAMLHARGDDMEDSTK